MIFTMRKGIARVALSNIWCCDAAYCFAEVCASSCFPPSPFPSSVMFCVFFSSECYEPPFHPSCSCGITDIPAQWIPVCKRCKTVISEFNYAAFQNYRTLTCLFSYTEKIIRSSWIISLGTHNIWKGPKLLLCFKFVTLNCNFCFTSGFSRYVWGFPRPEKSFNSKIAWPFRSPAEMLDAAGPCQGSSLAPLVVLGGVLASLEPRSLHSQHHCYCCSPPESHLHTAHGQAQRRDFPALEPETGTLTRASWCWSIEELGFLLSSFLMPCQRGNPCHHVLCCCSLILQIWKYL